MEKKSVLICIIIVGFLGLLSATAGLAAEFKKVKAGSREIDYIQYYDECSYPSNPAKDLGSAAAALLMIVRIIITLATGCSCGNGRSTTDHPNSKSTASTNIPRLLSFLSWITAIVACILLFSAASHSDEREPAETRYDGNSYEGFSTTIKHYCPVVKPGIFASGAVLSLVSSILGIACIALTSRSSRADTPTLDNPSDDPKQGGQEEIIAIGEPQFTPKNNNAQQPV